METLTLLVNTEKVCQWNDQMGTVKDLFSMMV